MTYLLHFMINCLKPAVIKDLIIINNDQKKSLGFQTHAIFLNVLMKL